jgi:methylmalonyl-CoA/ethylmalonyl-CoA epimerase
MAIMTDETFGPTLAVMPVASEDEAIRMANDTRFGLSAYIFTKSERRAQRVARQLECGAVAFNDVIVQYGMAALPIGGFKDSGLGKFHGREGLLSFSREQSVAASRVRLPMELWGGMTWVRGRTRDCAHSSSGGIARLIPNIMKILGIEHVAVAVEDLDEPARIFHQILGMGNRKTEEVVDQQVITDIFNAGQGKVEFLKLEFLKPTSGESPISKFLQERGPGLHHIAFLVDDLSAWLEHLKEQGVELIDKEPRSGAEGYLIAFLHPRSTAGVLVELCQRP